MLCASDPRCSARRAGSGTGTCDWLAAVQDATGSSVVFLHPGDRLRPEALAQWDRAIGRRAGAEWVLAATPEGLYNDWWFQPDMSAGAATLLAAGATFPECAARVERAAWQRAALRHPAIAADATRAGAWLALALESAPALSSNVVADSNDRPMQVDADLLARLVADVARDEPERAARILVDLRRVASGLRIAQDTLLDALEATAHCLGQTAGRRLDAADWRHRAHLVDGMVSRGTRPIWIWGAGQAGLAALAWLRARAVPVDGFLDRDPARHGQTWGGLPVCAGPPAQSLDAGQPPLVVVASMHHAEIAAGFLARGWREGREFVVFQSDVHGNAAGDAA